jgi:hypothetical protein
MPNLTVSGNRVRETKRNLLRLARSSFSSVEVFEDCSGGNSRLSYPLGCGGRSFFDQEIGWEVGRLGGGGSWRIGSKTTAFGVFFRLAARGGGTPSGGGRPGSSFGVFFRFQVTEFDLLFGFFSLCHLIGLVLLFLITGK